MSVPSVQPKIDISARLMLNVEIVNKSEQIDPKLINKILIDANELFQNKLYYNAHILPLLNVIKTNKEKMKLAINCLTGYLAYLPPPKSALKKEQEELLSSKEEAELLILLETDISKDKGPDQDSLCERILGLVKEGNYRKAIEIVKRVMPPINFADRVYEKIVKQMIKQNQFDEVLRVYNELKWPVYHFRNYFSEAIRNQSEDELKQTIKGLQAVKDDAHPAWKSDNLLQNLADLLMKENHWKAEKVIQLFFNSGVDPDFMAKFFNEDLIGVPSLFVERPEIIRLLIYYGAEIHEQTDFIKKARQREKMLDHMEAAVKIRDSVKRTLRDIKASQTTMQKELIPLVTFNPAAIIIELHRDLFVDLCLKADPSGLRFN